MNEMIGIFDSGIGGATVLKEILKELPNYQYLYYSDSFNNPYGDKSEEDLKNITWNVCKYLVDQGCKIIVIACNTASAICKEYLRQEFKVPIIAIEPAIKMVYDFNYDSKTLVLATKGTLNSKKFRELYNKYDNHKTVIYECRGLADLIEQNEREKIREYLKKHLENYKGVSNVVLGCTHYSLIKEEIKEVLGNVNFYDGNKGVVKELKRKIEMINLSQGKQKIIFKDTTDNLEKEKRFLNVIKFKK